MTNSLRYRYALFSQNTYRCFIDSPANQSAMISQGAVAFSVHSYSHPLEEVVRPKRIWGDLHLFFDWPHENLPGTTRSYTDLGNFSLPPATGEVLHYYEVPKHYILAYFHQKGIELIIPETTFRGDIGSPARLDFDRRIQEFTDATPLPSTLVNRTRVFWSTAVPKLSNLHHQRATPLSLLASEYFSAHEDTSGRKDYLKPNPAYIRGCKVFSALLNQQSVTEEYLVIAWRIIGASISYFLRLIEMHGGGLLLYGLNRQRFEAAKAKYPKTIPCNMTATFIAEHGGNYPCKKECGVTSPLALQYLPSSPVHHHPPYRSHNGVQLKRTGLYLNEADGQQTRLMNPIWVEEQAQFNHEEKARRLICFDDRGFRKELIVSEKDLSSTQLFALLHSNEVYTPNNTQDKGLIRDFIVSQFPRKPLNKPSPRVSRHGGWQNDNSFIFPGDNGSTVSGYVRQSQIVPAGEKSQKLLPPASIGEATADPYILLATLASLSAPYLKHRELTGLNLHFHGGTEAGRAAIIHAACSVWNQMPYVFADAKQHEVALKMQHKDAALGILEVPAAKTKAMNTLVRRYFNGRKGGDSGVRGIIVSCGETPMGQSTNRENGFHVFTYKNNVLGIDIWLGNLSSQGFRFNHTATKAIVQQLATNSSIHLEKIQANESRLKKQQGWATSPRPNRQVSDYLHFFMALGYVDQVSLQSWWRGDPLVSVFDQFMTGIDARDALFYGLLKQMNLSMPLPDILRELGASSITSFIEIDRHRILVPSKEMSKIAKDKPTLLRFISWLKARKILIPKRTGDLCGAHYSPKHKKTLRGYMISRNYFHKTLAKFTN
ncbi:uncharacterized protein DUF927 [Pseudodesulfovibrio indicus]|uniref:Uncharacterized protein DUF927 n=2 Tax=Pseudodesulfovibrio indicus TaxID=1716143 RepID=A0AA94PRN3_9BACT|nr:DUF927 domain-containing protein [Pseudodesulfovibrio indicus]TDT92235.1 uncharacterized protein DUF927 [Pseudodesulfovibrio indicus]